MATSPLLSRWRAVVARYGQECAVFEAPTGRTFTFAGLAAAARARAAGSAAAPAPRVMATTAPGVEFLLDTLVAWECGCVLCPLEPHATPPPAASWEGLPPGLALAKTTSGTTGAPRRVLFTAEALIADVDQIVATMGLRREWPHVAAISLAHSYGFSNLVLPLLTHGIPLWLAGAPLPETVRAAMAGPPGAPASGAVTLPGVPALWRSWFEAGLLDHRLGLALSAGAPLPLELEHAIFAATGVKLHTFLGASECGGIAYDPTPVPRRAATFAGSPMTGVRLTTDAGGLLRVESAAVASAFWPAEETPIDSPLGPGWFRTGDQAEARADGWHLLGRAAEVMNLAGRKVHPSEIEQCLRGHDAVAECLVFSVPSADAARGEEIVALLELKEDAPSSSGHTVPAPLIAALREWLGRTLPAWKCPRHWRHVPALPTDPRGKRPRAPWREWFQQRQG